MKKFFKLPDETLISIESIQSISPIRLSDCVGTYEYDEINRNCLARQYTTDEIVAMGFSYGYPYGPGNEVKCGKAKAKDAIAEKPNLRTKSKDGYFDYSLPNEYNWESKSFIEEVKEWDTMADKLCTKKVKNFGVSDENLDKVVLYRIETSARRNLGLNGTDNQRYTVKPEVYERLIENLEIV